MLAAGNNPAGFLAMFLTETMSHQIFPPSSEDTYYFFKFRGYVFNSLEILSSSFSIKLHPVCKHSPDKVRQFLLREIFHSPGISYRWS